MLVCTAVWTIGPGTRNSIKPGSVQPFEPGTIVHSSKLAPNFVQSTSSYAVIHVYDRQRIHTYALLDIITSTAANIP